VHFHEHPFAMPDRPESRDFLPTASWANLRLRAELLGKVRHFFQVRGFLEVETPILSADTVVDRHLHPFGVSADESAARAGRTRPLWLQTSPEFAMKRLMAAGGEAIYQVTRAFRRDELGSLHNPEFTMVEWYRRDDSMIDGMRLLSDLCEALLNLGPAAQVSYRAAFEQFAGVDPHAGSLDELAAVARTRNLAVPDSFDRRDRDAWLDLLLAELVEPHLGQSSPVILYDYPASQAALATVRDGDPPLAERFELYVGGIELANGFHELTDPQVLRERNRSNNAARVAEGKPPLPEQSRLLAAMEHGLPDCTGVALGFDRVVMRAAGASTLAEVLAFPFDRA
jgi:elongation factor P--(R)-beta-lysine ligase